MGKEQQNAAFLHEKDLFVRETAREFAISTFSRGEWREDSAEFVVECAVELVNRLEELGFWCEG